MAVVIISLLYYAINNLRNLDFHLPSNNSLESFNNVVYCLKTMQW